MKENPPHLVGNLLLRPIGMLAPKECAFVTAHGPVEPVRGTPSLFRTHTAENLNLLRTGLFVGQHIRIS